MHQIRSKCVSLGKVVLKFSNIYNNIKSNRKSGEGDSDWLTKARFRYQEEHKKPFHYEHVWDVLKGSEKYMRTPLIGTTSRPKRSKTSESSTPTTDASDAHGPFNVDDEDENEDEEERPRPIGRNTARASASASTGGASREHVSELFRKLTMLNTTSRELLDQKRRDLDLRERDLMFRESEAEDKRKRRDYRFYISPHVHLSGDMNFFKSMLSDDTEPENMGDYRKSDADHHKPVSKASEVEEFTNLNLTSSREVGVGGGGFWSFANLVKTITIRSESVSETYCRDLKES
ncbi:hypothetical protein OSB04_012481 [Centaurea solstitialis]|uniref:No apical meristem-associated C-terminal domain-containing protein n=1 Tax=Centaurea solstitialis TaxID=347529 RepID=A0AA38WEM4_9ASTR|nr:hypothetical protein OSB04_012481 [Centaurea solstitialis]